MIDHNQRLSVPLAGNRAGISKDVIGLVQKRTKPERAFQIRFNARSNLTVVLGSTRFNTNVNLEVLDSNRTVIATSQRLANRPEHIELKQLAPGTYFLQAVLVRGKQSRFRLRAQSTPIADTGNLPSTALPIALSSTPIRFNEFVGAEDVSDFYRFTLGGAGAPTGQLNLSLTGDNGNFLSEQVRVKIRDGAFNVVAERITSGQVGLSLEETLPAGPYFVQVEPASPQDSTNYQLTLAGSTIPDLAGNTPNAARKIEVGSAPSLFQDFVGAGDQQDYYQLTLSEQSQVNLKLTGPNGNLITAGVVIRLRDEVNNIIEQQTTVGNGSGVNFTRPLNPGNYLVQISTATKFVNYQLAASAIPQPAPA